MSVPQNTVQSIVLKPGLENLIEDGAAAGVRNTSLYRDPKFLKAKELQECFSRAGAAVPYFSAHEGINNNVTVVGGEQLINFSSYNYLALSGDQETSAYAKDAIDLYGTSVSASRIVSGEIPLHQKLERELADLLEVESCLLHVSGHATNVATIGHLFDRRDLILHDALAHNSVIEGCKLAGASRIAFAHNDPEHLNHLLKRHRASHRRVLVVVEGVYSMDGDIAPLPAFIALKKRHDALLMVDEAHSLGVLGARGRGIGEHFGIDRADVDLWMGTLSKSLASCGGYIAGRADLIGYLKFTSPVFVSSVGMPPANAAAALAALRILLREPMRVRVLRDRAKLFLSLAKQHGLDTGSSAETPIIPVILEDSMKAVRLSQELAEAGISAHPVIFPAVPEHAARVRFFVSAAHTPAQIRYTVATIATIVARLADRTPCPQRSA